MALKRRSIKRGTIQLKRTPLKRKKNKNSVPQESLDAVRARSGGRCEFMHTTLKAPVGQHGYSTFYGVRCANQADSRGPHHIERRRTGNHDPANLRDLCPEHHRFVHENPAWSYEFGYMARQGKLVREEEQ